MEFCVQEASPFHTVLKLAVSRLISKYLCSRSDPALPCTGLHLHIFLKVVGVYGHVHI